MEDADEDQNEGTSMRPPMDAGALPIWMRSIPENPTPEEVAERQGWIAALYPTEAIQEIVQKSLFTTDKAVADTTEFLLKAGYWYIDHKDERHPDASYSADKTQLDSVAAAASELVAMLQGLSEVSASALWHPFHNSWQFTHPMIEHGHKTPFGLTIRKYSQPDGSTAIHHLKPHDIEEALIVLDRLATNAAGAFPTQKGGQPRDLSRLSWMMSALCFWKEHSDIAFGYRTVAFDFCYLGFRKLDPSVSPEQVRSAMRAAAKELSKSKARKARSARVQEP